MELILPAVAIASSAIMIYSTYRLNRLSRPSYGRGRVKVVKGEYTARLKELEYRREMIRNAILNVVKEYDSGKIGEETKNMLLNRFRGELEEIESEIESIKDYAELERLEKEYNKLLNEYEDKRRKLEKRIRELRSTLRIRKEAKEKSKAEKKPEKKPRGEYDLEELMKEISKMISELEAE